jgi:HK97 family phage major capsid protein
MAKDLAEQINDITKAVKEIKSNRAANIVNGPSFEEELSKGIREHYGEIKSLSGSKIVSFPIKAAADMTFSNNFGNADVTVSDSRPGVVAPPNRKVHVRDLLAKGTLGKSDFAYAEESGGEGDLATYTEGSTKTQFDLDFQEKSVSAEYIAGFMVITRKMLDDVDSMVSYLQNRLREKYLRVEDTQLLTGNGTAPNLKGLITAATAATSTANNDYDQLLDALAQIEANDYNATGMLMNPSTYYKIAQYKASSSGLYDKPGIVRFVNDQLYFGGVPVYKSTAIGTDSYLVGDFQLGAQLMTREDPTVQFFEQDKTNVRENKVTVRVEGRIALPIYASKAFVTGTFATY